MRNETKERKRAQIRVRLRKAMKCLCSGEQMKADEMVPSSESLATKDYSTSAYSSQAGEAERKPDTGNIEEAESSLRESGSLNYEVLGNITFLSFLLLKTLLLVLMNVVLPCPFPNLKQKVIGVIPVP